MLLKSRTEVLADIMRNGFLRNYVKWDSHGEVEPTINDNTGNDDGVGAFNHDMHGLLRDAFLGGSSSGTYMLIDEDVFGVKTNVNMVRDDDSGLNSNEQIREELPSQSREDNFYRMLKDASKDLYPNCPISKLAAIVHLFHLKCMGGWSNKSFTLLLEFLREILPQGNVLPKSYNETKNVIKGLGLSYEKIHACPNDCMLFRGDKANDEICSKCGASRWKPSESNEEESSLEETEKKKPRAAKILRYFSLIPRLQRLFMSSKTAESMRWHDEQRNKEQRNKDPLLRHPADCRAWKEFDARNPDFAADSRNVRLGLAADGFNPFKTMNIAHSTLPVILIPYNVPPWVCMKQSNFILPLIIPGPNSPGNKIDVYLEPLIEELKILWENGVDTYDASKGERFKMRVAILWTIADLPGLATLSGWSTREKMHVHAVGMIQNRRGFIMVESFATWDIGGGWTEITDIGSKQIYLMGVKSYEKLLLECLGLILSDVMHTEKNVFDNTFGTTTGAEWKSKDNYAARCDLRDMGIRSDLHPQPKPSGKSYDLPWACYQMSNKEKDDFFKVLIEAKLPDEYSCNISRRVQLKQRRIIGLKTYDCHILMQELLSWQYVGVYPNMSPN